MRKKAEGRKNGIVTLKGDKSKQTDGIIESHQLRVHIVLGLNPETRHSVLWSYYHSLHGQLYLM